MPWYIYLPIAQHSVALPEVVGLGFVVGLLSGLFGVGGGFLMTPLLIMIGIPPTVAAASDSNQIVAASASGTYAHYRLGNVDFKMGIYLLIGGVIGGTGGVQIIRVLRQMGNADFLIKITYVVMLGFVGSYMFFESLQGLRAAKSMAGVAPATRNSVYTRFIQALHFQTRFDKSWLPSWVSVAGLSWSRSWSICCGCRCMWWSAPAFFRSCLPASMLPSCKPIQTGPSILFWRCFCWLAPPSEPRSVRV
jgi:hypothetical protein